MITSERIRRLIEVFNEDSDMTSMSSQTGYGFLMDDGVPKFEKISKSRFGPKIVHPMYLYIDHWGGKDLRVYFSQKLTPLSVDQSELGRKSGFEYYIPGSGSPVVVKRYLTASDYQDDASLEAAIQEMLKQCASIYLMSCKEWNGK
jgi:hypothetical protein